jgi:hypothetical protein
MFLAQTPVIPPQTPNIAQRRIRPGERTRYFVVSDWDSPNGKAHYEYDMSLEVQKSKEKRVEFSVVAKLTNLNYVLDGTELHRDTFGVIPMTFGYGGAPKHISAGGQITTFALPLLAWTVPDSAAGADGAFTVPAFRVESVGSFVGSGHVEKSTPNEVVITLNLTLGTDSKAPTLTAHSTFHAEGGSLTHSEGTYTDAIGTLTFKIDHR